jgi:DNA-binding transcriptional LysR family regulator
MEIERRHLQYVSAVAFHNSVTQAAVALGITQPALSRRIREIERLLGLRLFDRLPQGVVPTAACVALIERAKPLLGGFAALEDEAQRLGGLLAGEVVLGLGPAVTAGSALLEVAALLGGHPQLRCRVVTASATELVRGLEQLELDFFVGDLNAFDAGARAFVTEPLDYVGSLFCRAGHPLLRGPETLTDIGRHTVALLGPPPVAVDAVREALRELDPRIPAAWEPALVLDDANALTALMLGSDVVGGSAGYAHAEVLRSGRLCALPLARPVYRGRVGPVRLRERSLSAPAELLWKALAAALRRDLTANVRTAPQASARRASPEGRAPGPR